MPNSSKQKKTPWYLISELIFFIIPIATLARIVKKINYNSLIKALLIIVGLGYIWSMLVSANNWWWFNPNTMVGKDILPHLPLEEALFYPLGGALCILFYSFFSEKMSIKLPQERTWFFYIILGLTLFWITMIVLSFVLLNRQPVYPISQILLYNLLSLILWPKIKHKLHVVPILFTILLMTIIGFFWNWYAVVQKWWAYIAVLGWYWPENMPVDDWNFYFFATLAGTSLYIYFLPEEEI